MYRLGFFDLEAGRAAAVAVVMLVVNLSLAWVAGRLIMRGTTARPRAVGAHDRDARSAGACSSPASRAAAAAFLLPQLWLFSLSLKNKAGVYEYPPRWIPADGSLANYRFALTHTQVPWYLWNSAIVAVGRHAGHARGRRFRPPTCCRASASAGGRPLMAALLAVQMVSPVILLVPIYGVIERLGLIDTRGGLILVYAAMQVPFTVWVLKNFFDAVPRVALRGGALDGASRARTLWTIALPIVAPGLGATAIFNLAAYWSEFCAGARAARLAGALHDAARALQLPERLRDRLAAARGRQLHRLVPVHRGLRPPAALLRRRPHRRRGQRMTLRVSRVD